MLCCTFGPHQPLSGFSRVLLVFQIPADVLAGDAHTMALPVRSVQLFKVPAHDTMNFIGGGWRQLFTGRKKVCDFPEYPRVALGSTAHH